jgi:hypothetical protein
MTAAVAQLVWFTLPATAAAGYLFRFRCAFGKHPAEQAPRDTAIGIMAAEQRPTSPRQKQNRISAVVTLRGAPETPAKAGYLLCFRHAVNKNACRAKSSIKKMEKQADESSSCARFQRMPAIYFDSGLQSNHKSKKHKRCCVSCVRMLGR